MSGSRIVLMMFLLATGQPAVAGGFQVDSGNSDPGSMTERAESRIPSATLPSPQSERAVGRPAGSGRNCMKVCKQWGEDCITDPANEGQRKCRRSCQQFGMECF